METTSEEIRKEIEALKCRLQNRTPMRARFRLPLTKEETEEVLLASVKANIANRRMPFRMNDSLKRQLSEVADWLTGASSKFGLILCGGVGNGKSTFICNKGYRLLAFPQRRRDRTTHSAYLPGCQDNT